LSRNDFKQVCAATDKITSELFCLMRQSRCCLSNIHLERIGSATLNYEVATIETLDLVKSFMLQ